MAKDLRSTTVSRDELIEEVESRIKAEQELKRTQNQLVQSEKLASIGQLSAGIAHEINNPIGFIGSNLQILTEYMAVYKGFSTTIQDIKTSLENKEFEKAHSIINQLDNEQEKMDLEFLSKDIINLIQDSRSGVERIKRIVTDLKTFSREAVDETELVQIEETIDNILKIVENEIKYKAKLKKEYGNVPPVKCNSQKIGQVFINLLINAVQAIEGDGEIKIRSYLEDNYVCVAISDTGKGIPKDNLQKVFDPFFTTKPVGHGTGLGLSVSYEIVKAQGGEIRVQSAAGKGTTFTVMLPISESV